VVHANISGSWPRSTRDLLLSGLLSNARSELILVFNACNTRRTAFQAPFGDRHLQRVLSNFAARRNSDTAPARTQPDQTESRFNLSSGT
tara:strand:+ start:268 stop:534 length:267 start_codon:yes stop_codon:yes gene_type:complete